MKIDLGARKTEAGWQEALDGFWKAFTPAWFSWMEWVLILGVISYLAAETGHTALRLATGLSYGALFLYFQSLFLGIEFVGFDFIKPAWRRRLASLGLSLALNLAVWLLVRSLVKTVQGRV